MSGTPTRILPSDTAGSYSDFARLGSRAVTSSDTTVVRIADSIVISKMMTRYGHHATIGMPPTLIGQAREVPVTSSTEAMNPHEAPDGRQAEQQERVIALAELERLERLGRDHGDLLFRHAGPPERRERALRGRRFGVEAVDGGGARGHQGCVLQSVAASSGVSWGWVSSGCSPTLSSQIEMIGTNFEKSV